MLEFEARNDVWSILPRTFPTEAGLNADGWFDQFCTLYVTSEVGLSIEQVGVLRDVVTEARAQIAPNDVATLLFRPSEYPVTSVVHVQLFDAEGEDASAVVQNAMLPEVPLAVPPIVEPFEAAGLGPGHKGAFIVGESFADGSPAGGLSYAFATRGHVVNVFTSPTSPTTVGLMEDFLDDLVSAIRLVPGEAAAERAAGVQH